MSLFDSASLVVTPNGTKASKLYAIKPTDASGDLSVTRATTATRVNSSGLIESVANNVPRLDYTNSTCPSILVEPQRTNLFSYSEQFDNAYWGKTNMVIVANNTTAPDGTNTADRATASFYPSTSITKTNLLTAANHTLSVYIKAGSVSTFRLDLVTGGFAAGSNCIFNLNTLATTITNYGSTTGTTAFITNVGNGWYRCSLTVLTTAVIYFAQLLPAANGSVYLWGAQLEAGSYATSYIPTVASSVTRNADLINKSGIGSLFGTNKGTVFCDFVAANIQGTSQYIFDTSDGSNATTNRFAFYKIAAGSYELFTNTATSVSINSNTRNKVAITWNGSSVKVYANGVLKNSITYANANPTQINLGTRFNNVEVGDVNYNSYCIFPTDLTDAQLIELTTI